MIGAIVNTATTAATVAAKAVQDSGSECRDRVNRIDTRKTPITRGIMSAIFNSGARNSDRKVASVSAAVSSGSQGKRRSTSNTPRRPGSAGCTGLGFARPSAPW